MIAQLALFVDPPARVTRTLCVKCGTSIDARDFYCAPCVRQLDSEARDLSDDVDDDYRGFVGLR